MRGSRSRSSKLGRPLLDAAARISHLQADYSQPLVQPWNASEVAYQESGFFTAQSGTVPITVMIGTVASASA